MTLTDYWGEGGRGCGAEGGGVMSNAADDHQIFTCQRKYVIINRRQGVALIIITYIYIVLATYL